MESQRQLQPTNPHSFEASYSGVGEGPRKKSQHEQAYAPYLGNEGSCLDTDRGRPEQLRLRIRFSISSDGHPVHVGEARHRGQIFCENRRFK